MQRSRKAKKSKEKARIELKVGRAVAGNHKDVESAPFVALAAPRNSRDIPGTAELQAAVGEMETKDDDSE